MAKCHSVLSCPLWPFVVIALILPALAEIVNRLDKSGYPW